MVIKGCRVDNQNRISWNFLGHTFEQAFRRLEYVKKLFFLTPQSYWDRLPPKIQEHIITLAKYQIINDRNKMIGRDKVHDEICAYSKLKNVWGHGHIYIMPASWKPLGCYIYIATFYKG